MLPLVGAIALPLVGALVSGLVGPRARGAVALGFAALAAAAAWWLAAEVWAAQATLSAAPLGDVTAVLVDGLAAAMVVMTGTVGLAVALFAASWRSEVGARYWSLTLLLWAALQALFVADDLLTAYLAVDVISVVAVALVVLSGEEPALRAGTRYLLAEFVAAVTLLLGVALVWNEAGTVRISEIDVAGGGSAAVGLGFITVGCLLLAPLVPLHFWLPPAHARAPSAVSPLLSAVVVKAGFYLVVRLWYTSMPEVATAGGAQLLGLLGATAVLWGSVAALAAAHLKALIAYSTAAQLGYLFLLPAMMGGLPYGAGAEPAWFGGIYQAVAHALAKASLLMAAAAMTATAGSGRIADLRGAAQRRPVATAAFGLASASVVGLPPTGGFVAKWYLLLASVESGQWWWAPVNLLGGLLTAVYLMRVVRPAFAPPVDPEAPAVRAPGDVVALALAVGALAMGLRPWETLDLVHVGAPVRGG